MKKFFTVFVIVTITLLLLEGASWVALRLVASQPDPLKSETYHFDAHRHHRLNPDFQFSDDPKSRVHSSDGFRRDEPVSIIKPEKTVRIVVLGTSALYGVGATAGYPDHRPLFNDETITHFLEADLRQRLRREGVQYDIEVINTGVSGTRTFHHLMRMNDSMLEYSPDIVIDLDGHNDFYVDRIEDRWNPYPYSTTVLVDEFNGRTLYLTLFAGVRMLAPYSNFFNLVEKAFKRIWYASKVNGNPLSNTPRYDFGVINGHANEIREAGRRSYVRDLWQIHQLGRYAGYEHHVFLQPEIVFENQAVLGEADKSILSITEKFMGAASVGLMRKVRPILPELFAEAEIPYTDLGEIASVATSGEQLYIDYCHLTPEGASVLAGRMAQVIFPMVLKRIAQERKQ